MATAEELGRRKRRSSDEVAKLASAAWADIQLGMSVAEAHEKHDLQESVFRRIADKNGWKLPYARETGKIRKKGARKGNGADGAPHARKPGGWKVTKKGQRGKMDVRMLPPRPKKKGKRGGYMIEKPVDMDSIISVATRIARLDKRLRGIDAMVQQRIKLVARLLVLMKQKK